MKKLLLVLFWLVQNTSFGQNFVDLVNVYWRNSPSNSIEQSDQKRHFNSFVADVKLPVVLNEQNILIAGLAYEQNTIQQVDVSSVYDISFAISNLQIGLEHKWNERSKMLFMSFTRLGTDYNAIDGSHLQFGGLAFGTTKRSEDFHWKYGLYYNSEFFGNMFVPLFGFNWKINDKWRLKTVIPINLELAYRPKENVRMGLRFDGVNGSYRVTIPVNGNQITDLHVDKADNNAWLFSEFKLFNNVWFHVKAGHSVLRKYRVFPNDQQLGLKLGPVNIGDDRSEIIPLFKNGFSFETRFIYRLPL